MPLNKSWHDYNESLIERGRILIDIGFLKSRNKEIKKINEGKVGAPFEYSDSYIHFLAFLKIGFKIPYRTVQGIVRGLSDYIGIEEEIHLTQLRRRILQLKPHIEHRRGGGEDEEEEPITLVVDASGLTVSKKGDYIEVIRIVSKSNRKSRDENVRW
jgi:hypothetical protein